MPRDADTAGHQVLEPLLVLGGHKGGKASKQVPVAAAVAIAAAAVAADPWLLRLLLVAQGCNQAVSKGSQVALLPAPATE